MLFFDLKFTINSCNLPLNSLVYCFKKKHLECMLEEHLENL